MVKQIALGLFIISMMTACHYVKSTDAETPEKICTVPTNLPNNAIGLSGIQLIEIGQMTKVLIPSDSIFYPASSDLRHHARAALNAIARQLSIYRREPLVIRVYTDELGTVSLATQQAQRIQSFLWAHGFCHRCLTAVGIGPKLTVASNRTPLGSMANRRIEIIYSPFYDR